MISPEKIIPGESVKFKIKLLPHWSATKDGRTIEKEVTLDIPANFPVGDARLEVQAQYQAGGGFFFDFDDTEEEKPLPVNLDELIKQKKDTQIDPGSILISLRPPDNFGFDSFF